MQEIYELDILLLDIKLSDGDSVCALTEYDTPKKKDKICRQTTAAFQRNSVLQGFDGYAPCGEYPWKRKTEFSNFGVEIQED